MSSFDKYILEEKLVALGWVVCEDGLLVPPLGLLVDAMECKYPLSDAETIEDVLKGGEEL